MTDQTETKTLTPPRLIPTIVAGFNTVANRLWLTLIPVGLDFLLWFAPKLSLKNLLMPLVIDTTNTLTQLGSTDLTTTLAEAQKIWSDLLNQFNILVALRTFPVGVPSILARSENLSNPIGTPITYQIPNETTAILLIIGLGLLGFFLGTLYFNQISRSTAASPDAFQFRLLGRQFMESVAMALLIVIVGIFLLIPISFLISIFSLFGSGVMEFLVLLAGFGLLWILIPLAFSPHAVFVSQQRAIPSMILSSRMVRFFLPGTGTFVLMCALISEGLNLVWTVPPSNSWLTLIGILGHAFVTTGLLAATFIYYRDGFTWMQHQLQTAPYSGSRKPENGGFFGRFQ
jgi:hypothetical protein